VGFWDKKPANPLFSRVSAVPLLKIKLGFVPLFWDFSSKMTIFTDNFHSTKPAFASKFPFFWDQKWDF
jgi:hypothetical protein